LFVPSSITPILSDQFVVKAVFCCNVQFAQLDGHDTTTLVPERMMTGVGTAINTDSELPAKVLFLGYWTPTR
jgi:hypothetical protein